MLCLLSLLLILWKKKFVFFKAKHIKLYQIPLRPIDPLCVFSRLNDLFHANVTAAFSRAEAPHLEAATTRDLLRLVGRDENSQRSRPWRQHGAGIGCHKGWLTERLLRVQKTPVTWRTRYLIFTHPDSRRSRTMAEISCSSRHLSEEEPGNYQRCHSLDEGIWTLHHAHCEIVSWLHQQFPVN